MKKKIMKPKKAKLFGPRDSKENKERISRNTKLSEVLKINKNAAEILFNKGLACIGCPMAMEETLEQGCKAHGMNDKEIEDLLKKINKEK